MVVEWKDTMILSCINEYLLYSITCTSVSTTFTMQVPTVNELYIRLSYLIISYEFKLFSRN